MLSAIGLGQNSVCQITLICALSLGEIGYFARMAVNIRTVFDHCLRLTFHIDAHLVCRTIEVRLDRHDRPCIFGVEWHMQQLVALLFDDFVHWDVGSLQPLEQSYFRAVTEGLVKSVTCHFNVHS